MTSKPRLLFWLNGFFLHFSLAYYLQSNFDADYYGIIDINSKPKLFFKNQSLVDFKKIWFFHDHIKKIEMKDSFINIIVFINFLKMKFYQFLNKNLNYLKIFLMKLNLITYLLMIHHFIIKNYY
jgi:hypothetical protein